ncbi:hypothetical protein EP12_06660 [Alteromonas australica]|nr:hypothetical protein EP12_06660 [Alteromonas australica]
MAISTADWPYHLRVPIEYVPSEATAGQMLLLTEKVIEKVPQMTQDLFWLNVKNGGGDIRLCENDDGTGQLPIEVTLCDTVSRKLIIWYRTPTFTGVEILYLFYNNSSASLLPLTHDYGQYATWQDFAFASHNGIDDATGNIVFDQVGTLTPATGVFGESGGATFFDVAQTPQNYLEATILGFQDGDHSFRAWHKRRTADSEGSVVGLYSTTSSAEYKSLFIRSFETANVPEDSVSSWHRHENSVFGYAVSSARYSVKVNQWQRSVATMSLNERRIYLDDNDYNSSTELAPANQNLHDIFAIGALRDRSPGGYFDGHIAGVWWEKSIPSEAKVNTEYANQSNNTSFYGEPEFYKNGQRLHVFSGAVSLGATTVGESYKRSMLTANASISASTAGSSLKRVSVNAAAKLKAVVTGRASKKAQLAGSASINTVAQSSFTKKSILSGIASIKTFLTSRFYNKADNVETHTITIQGQLRESIEVKGFVNTNRN